MKPQLILAFLFAAAVGIYADETAPLTETPVDSLATVTPSSEEIGEVDPYSIVGNVIDTNEGFKHIVVEDAQEAMGRNIQLASQLDDPTTPEAVRSAQPEMVDGVPVKYPYALLLLENSCKLRNHFKGARIFVDDEMPKYKHLNHKFVGGLPRIHFFEDKDDLELSTVDASTASPDQLLEILTNLSKDPTYYDPKHRHSLVPLSKYTTSEEIVDLINRFGVEPGFFDSSRNFVITDFADDPSQPPEEKIDFDTDALLKSFLGGAGAFYESAPPLDPKYTDNGVDAEKAHDEL